MPFRPPSPVSHDAAELALYTAFKALARSLPQHGLFLAIRAPGGPVWLNASNVSTEFLDDLQHYIDAYLAGDPLYQRVDDRVRPEDADGTWSDDGRLTLEPAYYNDTKRVFISLLLVSDGAASEELIGTWSPEQRKAAAEWAISAYYSASDNDDVIVPPRPAFIPPMRGMQIVGGPTGIIPTSQS